MFSNYQLGIEAVGAIYPTYASAKKREDTYNYRKFTKFLSKHLITAREFSQAAFFYTKAEDFVQSF